MLLTQLDIYGKCIIGVEIDNINSEKKRRTCGRPFAPELTVRAGGLLVEQEVLYLVVKL